MGIPVLRVLLGLFWLGVASAVVIDGPGFLGSAIAVLVALPVCAWTIAGTAADLDRIDGATEASQQEAARIRRIVVPVTIVLLTLAAALVLGVVMVRAVGWSVLLLPGAAVLAVAGSMVPHLGRWRLLRVPGVAPIDARARVPFQREHRARHLRRPRWRQWVVLLAGWGYVCCIGAVFIAGAVTIRAGAGRLDAGETVMIGVVMAFGAALIGLAVHRAVEGAQALREERG